MLSNWVEKMVFVVSEGIYRIKELELFFLAKPKPRIIEIDLVVPKFVDFVLCEKRS